MKREKVAARRGQLGRCIMCAYRRTFVNTAAAEGKVVAEGSKGGVKHWRTCRQLLSCLSRKGCFRRPGVRELEKTCVPAKQWGGASLRSRGKGAGCSVRFRPGGGGELAVEAGRTSLVHEGGGVANAGEPGGVEMSAGSVTEGTCGEARGAR